jgi:hypothetical protein
MNRLGRMIQRYEMRIREDKRRRKNPENRRTSVSVDKEERERERLNGERDVEGTEPCMYFEIHKGRRRHP